MVVTSGSKEIHGLVANKNSYNSIKLRWYEANNAKEYKIYRATKKTEKYSLIKTTKSTKYIDKSLKTGTAYYYKIVAVSGGTTLDTSKIVGAKPTLTKPALTAKKKTATSITNSWKQIAGANGYEIYIEKGIGGYTKVKTITKNTTISYTKTGLEKGQTYRFKVRAYKNVGSKKVYSSYSAVKTVKL